MALLMVSKSVLISSYWSVSQSEGEQELVYQVQKNQFARHIISIW